ncbi:pancreatic lipase-related protein 2-like [Antedon mediterranea]|uniref:pancreatic lipase-related protein 2-like n=1 Tax=Antedon mediterranea TaxID=105859 RepID=UPI003AF8DA44
MAKTFGLVCCFLLLLSKLNDVEGFKTKFVLNTRRNNKDESLSAYDTASISNSNFNPANLTKFIIHGFQESSEERYVSDMSRSLLVEGDYNVILVDWEEGAEGNVLLDYDDAVDNVRLVGAEIAYLIKKLKSASGLSLRDVHLIGFSLGAHCAGYAGKILDGEIGRITGLDPAGRNYEKLRSYARLGLYRTDAMFVDIIHTEKTLLGLEKSVGHLDFYVNNGEDQTGCPRYNLKTVLGDGWFDAADESYKCDHKRAAEYFTASIDAEQNFTAYSCSSYAAYMDGRCSRTCGTNGCPRMGFHADEYRRSNQPQKFYLRTAAEYPYAATEITIEITMADRYSNGGRYNDDDDGELHIAGWYGSHKNTFYRMCLGRACNDKNQEFENGETYTYFTVIPNGIGKIEGVKLFWDEENFWSNPRLYIEKIEILDYPTVGKRLALCGTGYGIRPERTASFNRLC